MTRGVRAIDLNADLGELPGPEGRALDAAIMARVTSVNVACGGHAGDAGTMAATFAAARGAGVSVGAHPGYADRSNFGRVSVPMAADALADMVEAQVSAAAEAARAAGVRLSHLKPHGALYHDARAAGPAAVLAACAKRHGLALYGPPDGMMVRAARDAGVSHVAEGFADRAYRAGDLVPRGEPGAVIEDEGAQAGQALRLARGERWPDGPPPPVRTICLHGDTPGAAASAARLRAALEAAGVRVAAP